MGFSLFLKSVFKVSQGDDEKSLPKSQDRFKNVLPIDSPFLIHISLFSSAVLSQGLPRSPLGTLPGEQTTNSSTLIHNLLPSRGELALLPTHYTPQCQR